MTDLTTHARDLHLEELQREDQMRQGGIQRYNNRQAKQKQLSKSNTHHSFITNALTKVSEGITQYIDLELAKGRGKPYRWVETLKDLDPDKLAYIGLNTFMDAVGQSSSLTACTAKIAKRVELEAWSRDLKRYNSKLHRKAEQLATKGHQTDRKRIAAVKSMVSNHSAKSKVKFTPQNLDVAIKAFAEPVVNAVLEFSDIFEVYTEFMANRTKKMIGLTPEASAEIVRQDIQASWRQPMFAPMITPPVPWTSLLDGGYASEELSHLVPLVRGSCYEQSGHIKHDFAKAATEGEVPAYVEALNALQAVPLKINTAVLELVQHCWDSGESFKKFPLQYQMDLPESPTTEAWEALTVFEKNLLRMERTKIMKKNREITGRSCMMEQDLSTATELASEDQFYLVWNMCFRGRFYPVSNFSYHRDDHIKALTLLKNGSLVTSDNCEWSAIHLANCGDFNKISKQDLSDRVLWVEFNEPMIRSIVKDPVANLELIQSADKPFQFYAACVDWVGYLESTGDYISCLPPALDGSNSGVQHYSALSLNEVDGALVNLVPSDIPQDVYQTVADRVNTKLQRIALASTVEANLKPRRDADGNVKMPVEEVRKERKEGARLWLDHGVTRSTVKRNTMTYPYSSNQYGFADQVTEDLMKPLADRELVYKEVHPFGTVDQQFHATRLFAEISYESVQEVISSAAQGMKFLQSVSIALSKENKPTHWRSPVGFPAVQKYTKWKTKKVRLYLYDREAKVKTRAQMSVRREDKFKIDTAKSKAGIAANFVHSLDSAHLANTVLSLVDNGITDFMVIHDSFAVGVEDTWTLFDTVRATFVDQYQDTCLYTELKSTAEQNLAEPDLAKFEPIPVKGNLDMTEVMASDYCFA